MWRLLESGPSGAFENMALDEAICMAVREGKSLPTLRFYLWEKPSVSIGRHQRAGDIDIDFCRAQGIPMVRRPTGGRAVLHSEELTYSLSCTLTGLFNRNMLHGYALISRALALGFKEAGVKAKAQKRRDSRYAKNPLCFQSSSFSELSGENGEKLAGSAQRRYTDGFLQQGSIPFSLDPDTLRRITRPSPGSGQDSLPVRNMPGLLKLCPGLDEKKLRQALKAAFEEVFSLKLEPSPPSPHEEALARRLVIEKYQTAKWNFLR